jgi:hypothetical protein
MTMDLEQQVRDYVQHADSQVELVAVDELSLDVEKLRRPAPVMRVRRGLAAALAAAALVLIVVGGALIASRSDRTSPPVATEPPPTAVPTTAPAAIAPAPAPEPTEPPAESSPATTAPELPPVDVIPAPTGVMWEDLPDDGGELFEGQYFYGVTVGGPGLVAVGAECDTIFYDPIFGGDTTTWFIYDETVDPSTFDEAAEPGCRWEDAGLEDPEGGTWSAAVWTSVDGIEWDKVPRDEQVFGGPGDVVMVDVVAGGPGLVAVGEEDASWIGSTAAIWTSVDGLSWQKLQDSAGVFAGRSRIDAVTAGGPGLVAVGIVDNKAAAWTSVDGLTWARATVDGSQDIGTTKMHDVTVGGPGLVAVGVDYAAEWPLTEWGGFPEGALWRAAVWTSVDGTDWTRVSHDEQVFGGYPQERLDSVTVIDGTLSMWAVQAIDDGLVAAGWSLLERAAWFSPDGLEWVRISEYDEAWGDVGIGTNGPAEAIVADGSRFAGVGWDPDAEYFQERQQWRHDPAGPWGDAMTDAVVFEDHLIAVGYAGTHITGAIWIGTWS